MVGQLHGNHKFKTGKSLEELAVDSDDMYEEDVVHDEEVAHDEPVSNDTINEPQPSTSQKELKSKSRSKAFFAHFAGYC